jgi:hypothetical protein
VTRRVRAFFAPVNRVTGAPTLFDPAQQGRFALNAPPAPWLDLGWTAKFTRRSGSKVDPLRSGAPAAAAAQVRTELEATLALEFESWGKLQTALASGSQQMNLLATTTTALTGGSGGTAAAAVPLVFDSNTTATALDVGAASAGFAAGDLVAVDVDYAGATGYVGSGVSAAYVQSGAAVGNDVNYVRRMTWNVGLVTSVANGVLQLGAPLLAGAPRAGMQVSKLVGFCDREGTSFFQEWSALFVMEGEQGDRVLFHYPRLQPMQGSAEVGQALAGPLEEIRLAAAFRALPVKDANDGETVLCFRSYLPAPMRAV